VRGSHNRLHVLPRFCLHSDLFARLFIAYHLHPQRLAAAAMAPKTHKTKAATAAAPTADTPAATAPMKRRAATLDSMASAAKRRRRITAEAVAADHSKCKWHVDAERRRTCCNAVKQNGKRCTAKVDATISQIAFDENRLPMCGVHAKDLKRIGYCTAIAACGQKCDRLVPQVPSQYPLCKAHQEVSFCSRCFCGIVLS
jgi:hypothetical protein